MPSGTTTDAFWSSLRQRDDHYLAFLLSFVVISAAWSQHHHVLRYTERGDERLRTLNMLWLMTIILNPFATQLLTSEGHDGLSVHALRFGFYAVLEVLASSSFLLMVRHVRAHGLQAPDTPPRVARDALWRCGGVIAGFGASIPLFFVTRDAWVLWIAGPVLAGQARRRQARAVRSSEPARSS